jgi:hypothetical protein
VDEEDCNQDTHRESYELEAYDLSKASVSMSREERLQFSKENELRRQYDDGDDHEEKDYSDDQIRENDRPAAIVKRKKPAPPPNGPQPRWKSPSRGGGTSDEEEGSVGKFESSRSSDKPVKKRGVSIEDMIDDEPVLTVNLDDDSDEEEKVDFKVQTSSSNFR